MNLMGKMNGFEGWSGIASMAIYLMEWEIDAEEIACNLWISLSVSFSQSIAKNAYSRR